MNKSIFSISILFFSLTFSVNGQVNPKINNDTLKNETIIKMAKAKLGDKIILQKINTSPTRFDVSTDALIKLKENNVSDEVVDLMVNKQSMVENSTDNNYASNSDGSNYTFKKSGIYFLQDKKYITLDPTLVTSTRSSGSNCLFAYGLDSKKSLSQIAGKDANYQFNETPTFYFNFIPVTKDLGSSSSQATENDNYLDLIISKVSGNQAAISPNEFKLIRLDVKGNKREYLSSQLKVSGNADVGIGDKNLAEFKYAKVSDHTYKVSFPNGLPYGEYCFYYLSNSTSNPYYSAERNNIKVFDFGVK